MTFLKLIKKFQKKGILITFCNDYFYDNIENKCFRFYLTFFTKDGTFLSDDFGTVEDFKYGMCKAFSYANSFLKKNGEEPIKINLLDFYFDDYERGLYYINNIGFLDMSVKENLEEITKIGSVKKLKLFFELIKFEDLKNKSYFCKVKGKDDYCSKKFLEKYHKIRDNE
jgi:hypothetical protein